MSSREIIGFGWWSCECELRLLMKRNGYLYYHGFATSNTFAELVYFGTIIRFQGGQNDRKYASDVLRSYSCGELRAMIRQNIYYKEYLTLTDP